MKETTNLFSAYCWRRRDVDLWQVVRLAVHQTAGGERGKYAIDGDRVVQRLHDSGKFLSAEWRTGVGLRGDQPQRGIVAIEPDITNGHVEFLKGGPIGPWFQTPAPPSFELPQRPS